VKEIIRSQANKLLQIFEAYISSETESDKSADAYVGLIVIILKCMDEDRADYVAREFGQPILERMLYHSNDFYHINSSAAMLKLLQKKI